MAPRARIHFLFGLALLLALTTPALGREQKILQKKASAPADPQVRAADAWIDQTPGSTTALHGGDTTLRVTSFVNVVTNQNQRALVQFDLSSVPRSGIKLATLKLFMSTAPSVSRNYDVHRLTSLWTEGDVSWDSRLPGPTAWTVVGGGGDFSGAVTATTASGTTSGVTLSWTVTSDLQLYFGGAPPSANYGAIIVDSVENASPAVTAIFSSKEDPTEANHPSLTVEFIQQVTGLTAVPGNSQVVLNWSYPPPVGTVSSATTGVVILRKAGSPIAQTTVPTDGVVPAACSALVDATTVFVNGSNAVTFNDSATGDNPGCAPSNGTTYYYKVFTRDADNNYSANGADSSFVAEIMATPGATASAQQAAVWMAPTGAATLAPAGLIPSTVVAVGSNSNLLQGFNPNNGTDVFGPASTGGAIGPAFGARLPVVEAAINSLNKPATFVPNQDNFVYAVDTSNGQIIWLTNPTGETTNSFGAGAGVLLKSIASGAYTLLNDLVIVGTRNGPSSTNHIVGIDANTGVKKWSVDGNSTASQSQPGMGAVNSTPLVDYVHNFIWVTTRNFTNAANPGRPDLWKINPNTGAVLGIANLTFDADASPTLTRFGDVLFAATVNTELKAVSPTLDDGSLPPNIPIPTTLATYAPPTGSGLIQKGFPLVLNFSSPYTIIFVRNTSVHAVSFNTTGNVFTGLWDTTLPCNVSAPIGFTGLSTVYVGCSDGQIHELNLATGVDQKQRIVNTTPVTVGDPSLDIELSRIIVGATDGRVYAFTFPF